VLLGRGNRAAQDSTRQTVLTAGQQHSIDLPAAAGMTKRYRSSVPAGSFLAEAFGKNALDSLLRQPGAIGMRIYLARHADSSLGFVLVAVDTSGSDMTSGALLETGFPCPPDCDLASPLTK
jgi:hypothetical protein